METLISLFIEGITTALVLFAGFWFCTFLDRKVPILKDRMIIQTIIVFALINIVIRVPPGVYLYWSLLFVYVYYWGKIASKLSTTMKWMKRASVQFTTLGILVVVAIGSRHLLVNGDIWYVIH